MAEELYSLGVELHAAGTDEAATKFTTSSQKIVSEVTKAKTAVTSASTTMSADFGKIGTGMGAHLGLIQTWGNVIAKNAGQAQVLLRALGPLGGEATELAARMERAGLSVQTMGTRAANSASAHQILTEAFNKGEIAANNFGAVQQKVSAALAAQKLAMEGVRDAEEALAIERERARVAQTIVSAPIRVERGTDAQFMQSLNARKQAQLDLSLAEQNAGVISASLADQERKLAAANREVATAHKLESETQAAASSGFGKTAVVVGGLVASLAVLAAGIYAVHKAWQLVKSGFEAAAGVQKASFSLGQLIGNTTLASQKLAELREFEGKQGAFSFPELADAARQIFLLTGGTEQLIPHVKDFASLAVKSGESLTGMITGYSRLQQAIGSNTQLMTRGIGGARVIMDALIASTGKTEGEIQKAFKNGTITIEMANKALHDYAMSTDSLGAHTKTWEGQIGLLGNRWEEVRVKLGTPIVDTLTGVLTRWGNKLEGLESPAEKMGEAISRAILNIEKSIQEGNFGSKIAEGILKGIVNFGWAELKFVWTHLFYEWPKAAWSSFLNWIKTVPPAQPQAPVGFGAGNAEYRAMMQGGMPAGVPPKSFAGALGPVPGAPPEELPSGFGEETTRLQPSETKDRLLGDWGKGGGGGMKESDFDKFETDIQKINSAWEDYTLIQSKAQSETERTRMVMSLIDKTAKDMTDPAAFIEQFRKMTSGFQDESLKRLAIWEAEQAAKEKAEAITDAKIKAGIASIGESMSRGVQKVTEGWGSMTQQVSDASGQIVEALSTGISGGLTDILTGTKNLKDGFRDMALSIIQSIEQIIVKMLVQLAIQRLLGTFGSYGEGSSVSQALGPLLESSGLQSGGYTGNIAENKIAGFVHGKEYVFDARVTQKLGLPFLKRIENAAKGHTGGYEKGGYVSPAWQSGVYNHSTTHSQSSNVTVVYNAATGQTKTEGNPNIDSKRLAMGVKRLVQQELERNKHPGGSIYMSAVQRGAS